MGEFYTKINDNRTETLDIKEYTDSMKAMHKILIESLLYSVQRKKGLPPFTVEFLKDGLRNSWIAEMIGHLIIKYESEWYADEALTKWKEIDNLLEEEKQKQKKLLQKLLDQMNIREPFLRDYALNMVDEEHEKIKSIWQLEKEQRIKPSLWWREVAQSQPTQSSNNQTPQTPALSNLSTDGKAWFIHPVSMLGRFVNPGIVTYHIYHDGKIEKHIPQEILKGYEQKYKYVYHDQNGNEHEICICDWHTINKLLFKKLTITEQDSFTYPKYGTVSEAKKTVDEEIIVARAVYTNGAIHEWIRKGDEIDIQERLTLSSGDIAEYGKTKGWVIYKRQKEEAQLVRLPDSLNYSNGDVVINYQLEQTYRKYTNPDVMAGFLGALAEIKLKVISTGSAFKNGSCYPSKLHVNGESIDTAYFNRYARYDKNPDLLNWDNDKAFIRALHKFHFQNFRIGIKFKKTFENMPGYIDGKDLHNSHLHTENFDEKAVITKTD